MRRYRNERKVVMDDRDDKKDGDKKAKRNLCFRKMCATVLDLR